MGEVEDLFFAVEDLHTLSIGIVANSEGTWNSDSERPVQNAAQ